MRTIGRSPLLFASLIVLFFITISNSRADIILQPGPIGGQDTWVGNLSPDQNHGNDDNLYFGANVTLGEEIHLYIRFDFSEVPTGTIITDARLEFFMWGQNGWMSYIYGVFPVQETWDEQTITWNNLPSATTDSETTFDGAEWQGMWDKWQMVPGLAGLVQSWVDNPNNNHGMLIRPISDFYGMPYLLSSDTEQAGLQPRMILEIGPVATEVPTWDQVKALYR